MEKELRKRMSSGAVETGVEIYKRNNLKSNLKQRKMIYTKWRR